MALEFLYRDAKHPARVALFPGSWNPPTVAHDAIAHAALHWADEVVWIIPATLPHKVYEGTSFEDRGRLVERIARSQPGFSAAISQGGLYAEIAAEARGFFGPATEIGLVLGRDAAERIANWDYGAGNPDAFRHLLHSHPLLVAARAGDYEPPEEHADRIIRLPFQALDDVSSTEVRRRIREGLPWRHLVPPAVADFME